MLSSDSARCRPLRFRRWPHGGVRRVHRGRFYLRCLLYMATLFPIHRVPGMQAFYERLVTESKARRVDSIAGIRNFSSHVNAVLR